MKKTTIALIVALIILALGAVTAAGYFGYQYYKDSKASQKSKNSAPSSKSSTTEGWNTYLSDQLYFTFDYPPTWTYEQSGYTNENWQKYRSFNLTYQPVEFDVEVNPSSVSASPLAHVYDNFEKLSSETVKLDTVDATKEIWQTTIQGKEIEKGEFKGVDLKFNHGTDSFRVHFKYNLATEKTQFANYEKLIKTWKFTQDGPAEVDMTTEWLTYTNNKYGYSFKHPATYTIGNCPKPCAGQVNTLEGGDHTFMSGDISSVGWPMVSITHYDTEFYNPTIGTTLYQWLVQKAFGDTKTNLPAGVTTVATAGGNLEVVKVEVPASPQAYSRWEFYFIKNNKMFQIQMLDIVTAEAKEFYNAWLTTFTK